ncbi:MAG: hypothetical protein KKH12_16195 [Gammaproteobacteria bacterium]|nr:hypothetical protein [Gammaproteobacteria bacterium]
MKTLPERIENLAEVMEEQAALMREVAVTLRLGVVDGEEEAHGMTVINIALVRRGLELLDVDLAEALDATLERVAGRDGLG